MLAEVNNNADIQVYHCQRGPTAERVNTIRALFQKGRPNPSTILQESFCLFVFGTPECGKHERPTCHPSLLNIHACTCAHRKVPVVAGLFHCVSLTGAQGPFHVGNHIVAIVSK
jgi:hypothetical protein